MDAAARSPLTPPPGCPRCGSSAGSPFWSGGVCLRCAGARLESDAAPGGPRTRGPDPDGLPDHIGPYEILEELGRGGMGRVYAARQTGLGRIVALKVMGGHGRSADFELRFLREAQIAARLRHPNLVAVHDFGRADGDLYFSMDYIEGGDLARRLRGRAFAPWEAASLVRKVALALAHAHEEGVLHRDLKPSNILMDGDEPRLADFGLAAPLGSGGDLTAATCILGTPHYLAPEALEQGSAALSVASDLYALGIVLFELLTGRTPFAGAAPGALAALVAGSEPPSPRLLAPAVPRDLETLCLKCIERDPARRYAGAAALAEDLRRFLDGEPILARPLSGPDRFLRWGRRRPALASVWVLLTALAAGSTFSTIQIRSALSQTRAAEAQSRERLREARLAEARAVRRTSQPGRRAQALAALAEAAAIRPGPEIRDEGVAALMTSDIEAVELWSVAPEQPGTMAFDPTAKVVAFEVVDSTGRIREPAVVRAWGTTNVLAKLTAPGTNAVGVLRFSRDGSRAMERFLDDTLRVWRTGEAPPYLTLSGRPAPGGGNRTDNLNDDHDFSPDSSMFVLGLPERGFSLHRVADGSEVARSDGGDRFHRVRYAPDGRHIAAARMAKDGPHAVHVLEAPSLKPAHRFSVDGKINSVAWAGDGDLIAVSLEDGTIDIFRLSDGRPVNRFHSPTTDPNELMFLGSDTLLAMRGRGSRLYIVDLLHGREQTAVDGFGRDPLSVAPDGETFFASSVDGVATRWRTWVPTGARTIAPPHPGGYEQSINSCSFDFSPDGRRVVSVHGRYLVLQDVATGGLLAESDDGDTHGIEWSSVAFVDGGRAILRSSHHTGIWRLPILAGADGRPRLGDAVRIDTETGLFMTDHSPDCSRIVLASVNEDGVRMVAWDGTGLKEVGRWKVPGAYSGALDPKGERVLINCSGTGPEAASQRIRVLRVADGTTEAELPGMAFGEAGWSADGSTAMTSNGQTESVVWDTATWRPRAKLTGAAAGNMSTFAISPDGRRIAVARDDRVHLLDAADGSTVMTLPATDAGGLPSAVRFLPDGRRIAVLWRDARMDIFDPDATARELSAHGLAWPVGKH